MVIVMFADFEASRVRMRAGRSTEALPQSPKSCLDQVSTGSGSDLVSDQHAIFLTILDFMV